MGLTQHPDYRSALAVNAASEDRIKHFYVLSYRPFSRVVAQAHTLRHVVCWLNPSVASR